MVYSKPLAKNRRSAKLHRHKVCHVSQTQGLPSHHKHKVCQVIQTHAVMEQLWNPMVVLIYIRIKRLTLLSLPAGAALYYLLRKWGRCQTHCALPQACSQRHSLQEGHIAALLGGFTELFYLQRLLLLQESEEESARDKCKELAWLTINLIK